LSKLVLCGDVVLHGERLQSVHAAAGEHDVAEHLLEPTADVGLLDAVQGLRQAAEA
jgi:hypothetical protein